MPIVQSYHQLEKKLVSFFSAPFCNAFIQTEAKSCLGLETREGQDSPKFFATYREFSSRV
jgi:hypothetical protein